MTPALPRETEVLVVGAGIAGSALALELSKRGVHVVLIDRAVSGPAGASTVPAALINPNRGRTARASSRDLGGAQAFWRMIRELEDEVGPSGAHRTGVLRLPDNPRQAHGWRELEGTRWLEPRDVPNGYHAPHGALLVTAGGWLNSAQLLAALQRAARQRGAEVRWGTEFVTVEGDGSEHRGATAKVRSVVRDTGGEAAVSLDCRAVVVATGAHRLPEMRSPRLELVWGEALTLRMEPTPTLPLAGSVVAAFGLGRAYVSGGHRHVGWLGRTDGNEDRAPGEAPAAPTSPAAHPPASGQPTEQLPPTSFTLRALSWRVPAAEGAAVISRWEGVRAKRPSGEPVVRRLRPGVHLMLGFGGRGFLRASAAAASLAERLAAQLGR